MIITAYHRIIERLKSLLLHGLIALLPIAITFGLIRFIFRMVRSWLAPIHDLEPAALQKIPYSEFLLSICLIIIVGLIYELFLKNLIYRIEMSILKKIPLLSLIYFGVKRIAAALSAQDKTALHHVLLVEFPSNGIYSIGFATGELTEGVLPLQGKYLNVFVPHTPNPTTGFYVIIEASRCKPLSITRQEAMELIISGGIVTPHREPHASHAQK